VIGNGESRKSVDLDQFRQNNITIGCNAIHRDFSVDHLICCDNRMVKEALLNQANKKIYTRHRYYQEHRKIGKNKNIFLLPELPYHGLEKQDDPVHWGSGPYAVLLATILLPDEIFILGFDLYSNDGKINNCYKGTNNYSPKDSQSVDPSYWIYQIKKVFELNSGIKFKIYNHHDWKMPREWKLDNVTFSDISELKSIDNKYHSSIIIQ
jgi:hypothetical protein